MRGKGFRSAPASWSESVTVLTPIFLIFLAAVFPMLVQTASGVHTIERSYAVTSHIQRAVFTELHDQRVQLEGMLLKPNMVLSGYDCPQQASPDVWHAAMATGPA